MARQCQSPLSAMSSVHIKSYDRWQYFREAAERHRKRYAVNGRACGPAGPLRPRWPARFYANFHKNKSDSRWLNQSPGRVSWSTFYFIVISSVAQGYELLFCHLSPKIEKAILGRRYNLYDNQFIRNWHSFSFALRLSRFYQNKIVYCK